MNINDGVRSLTQRQDLDPLSTFYEERASPHMHLKLTERAMPGLSLFFDGIIDMDCENFCIDMMSEESGKRENARNVLLRIEARLPQNYIVRNSRLKRKWGHRECSSNLAFQLERGQKFSLQVLITHKSFFISVNGYHFAEYFHRMPYKWLSTINVRGAVTDVNMDTHYITEYPNRLVGSLAKPIPFLFNTGAKLLDLGKTKPNIPKEWLRIDAPSKFLKLKSQMQTHLTLPFYGRLSNVKRLTEGHALRIEGRVRLLPHSFSVALQQGQDIWPQPTVSFYFCPSFSRNSRSQLGKAIITRSAHIEGAWINREVSSMHTGLGPGKAFDLLIICRQNCYEVHVNHKLLLNFNHHMHPSSVDIVNIRGDIKLWEVVLESTNVTQGRSHSMFGRAMSTLRQNRKE